MSIQFDTSAMQKKLEDIAIKELEKRATEYADKMKQLLAYERNVHNTAVMAWSKRKNVNGQLLPDGIMPPLSVEGSGLEFTVTIGEPSLEGLNDFQKRGYEMCFSNVKAKMKNRK